MSIKKERLHAEALKKQVKDFHDRVLDCVASRMGISRKELSIKMIEELNNIKD